MAISNICQRCKSEYDRTANNQKYCCKTCQKKTWNENNSKKITKARRKYQINNKDNPEYIERNRVNDGKYKRKNKNNPDYIHKKRVRCNSKERRKSFCEECGSNKDLQLHHENYDNNQGKTLCKDCHLKVHGKKRLSQEDLL